jgi:hypothetical protein
MDYGISREKHNMIVSYSGSTSKTGASLRRAAGPLLIAETVKRTYVLNLSDITSRLEVMVL